MNSVKIYGANSGRYGSTRDAQERFWRNIFGGLASSRFHRPLSGLGLSDIAQAHIRSMRMFTDQMDLWSCEPHNDLLGNRSWNEAYCTANPGVEWAVFYPDGGNVLPVGGRRAARSAGGRRPPAAGHTPGRRLLGSPSPGTVIWPDQVSPQQPSGLRYAPGSLR